MAEEEEQDSPAPILLAVLVAIFLRWVLPRVSLRSVSAVRPVPASASVLNRLRRWPVVVAEEE